MHTRDSSDAPLLHSLLGCHVTHVLHIQGLLQAVHLITQHANKITNYLLDLKDFVMRGRPPRSAHNLHTQQQSAKQKLATQHTQITARSKPLKR